MWGKGDKFRECIKWRIGNEERLIFGWTIGSEGERFVIGSHKFFLLHDIKIFLLKSHMESVDEIGNGTWRLRN